MLTTTIILISVVAAITDLIWGRIFNVFTFPLLVAGFGYSFFVASWPGLGASFGAAVLGLLLYGWMFAIGMMGGGDVKLLMVLGAWGGIRFTEEVAILGVLLGGVMAVGILLSKGKLGPFFRKMYAFFRSVLVKELSVEKLKIDRKLTMPFGLPIAVAAIWTILAHPLEQWGIPLWP